MKAQKDHLEEGKTARTTKGTKKQQTKKNSKEKLKIEKLKTPTKINSP
jgi:hypothetical protein